MITIISVEDPKTGKNIGINFSKFRLKVANFPLDRILDTDIFRIDGTGIFIKQMVNNIVDIKLPDRQRVVEFMILTDDINTCIKSSKCVVGKELILV